MKQYAFTVFWGVCILILGFATTLLLMGGTYNVPLMMAFSGIGAIICFGVMLLLLLSAPSLSVGGQMALGVFLSVFILGGLILFVVMFGSGQPFWLMFALKTIPQLLPLLAGCCYFSQRLFEVWMEYHHAHLSDMF